MITVTANAHNEKLKIVEKEIILNGPPSNLQGNIQFVNRENDPLRIKTLGLLDKNKKQLKAGSADLLKFSFRLRPGEQKLETIYHQLPSNTPPGTYENYIMLGKKQHKVKMIVQPTIDIGVSPSQFTFQGTSPNTVHVAVITLTNRGNMPFQVPELKHAAVLDMDLLCRAFGNGFRKKGNDTFLTTLDEVANNLKENLTEWVSISVDEAGKIVQPGDSLLLHVNFTLPKSAVSTRDYNGDFRFWDKFISVLIKSHNEQKKKQTYGKKT